MRIDVSGYQERGYVIASGLFSDAEVERYRQHYMDLNRKRRKFKSDPDSFYKDAGDPLKRFPRMIHMHRDDQLSLDWMLHPRLAAAFRQLLGVAPLAVQDHDVFQAARRARPSPASRSILLEGAARHLHRRLDGAG